MYNIKRIQEIMQKHGFSHENDERTCWNLGAGLHIRFDDDMDEPGIVLSHSSSRDYFSRKLTMDEFEAIVEVVTLFNLGAEKVIALYNDASENNEVIRHIPLSTLNELQEKIKTLSDNLDSLAEDYNELLEEKNKLHDSYKAVKENLERLVNENDELNKSCREYHSEYNRIRTDYLTYRRALNCVMTQFEERDDW